MKERVKQISGPVATTPADKQADDIFLAHQIKFSAVYAHVRKFYLTYPILTLEKVKSPTAPCPKTSGVMGTLK